MSRSGLYIHAESPVITMAVDTAPRKKAICESRLYLRNKITKAMVNKERAVIVESINKNISIKISL